MQEEVWKDVPGFEGDYSVSSLGNVKSNERTCQARNIRKVRERILKPQNSKDRNGKVVISKVKLSSDGKPHCFSIGRLVLMSFHGDEPEMVAHFKNGDATDARLSNLEWSTFNKIAAESEIGYVPPRKGGLDSRNNNDS